MTGLCPNSKLISKISDDACTYGQAYKEIIKLIIKLFEENNYQN